MGNTNVNAAAGNQPVAPKGNQKSKKIGLDDWARSIFNSQFSKIDKNGNGVIDNGTEARQLIDWYTSMRDTAMTYLQNKFNKNELYLHVSNNIREAADKVVKIWADLSIKHFNDAVKLKDSPDEKSSGKAQKNANKEKAAKSDVTNRQRRSEGWTSEKLEDAAEAAWQRARNMSDEELDDRMNEVAGRKGNTLNNAISRNPRAARRAGRIAEQEAARDNAALAEAFGVDVTKNAKRKK